LGEALDIAQEDQRWLVVPGLPIRSPRRL